MLRQTKITAINYLWNLLIIWSMLSSHFVSVRLSSLIAGRFSTKLTNRFLEILLAYFKCRVSNFCRQKSLNILASYYTLYLKTCIIPSISLLPVITSSTIKTILDQTLTRKYRAREKVQNKLSGTVRMNSSYM